MRRILKAELIKLKRYHIIWAGIILMLLSVVLTLFTSMANDGSTWDFTYLIEQVIKNNMSTIFPMCITLIAGYIIAREQKDDTLKNIKVVPISYRKLLFGKLLVCGLIAIFLGIVCTLFTVIAEFLVKFPGFSVQLVGQAFIQITLNCLFLYIAVLPVIILTSRLSNGYMIGAILSFVYGYGGMFAVGSMTLANMYPITASLGLINYRSYDSAVNWNKSICTISLVAIIILSTILLINSKEGEWSKREKKKQTLKKGW